MIVWCSSIGYQRGKMFRIRGVSHDLKKSDRQMVYLGSAAWGVRIKNGMTPNSDVRTISMSQKTPLNLGERSSFIAANQTKISCH